MALSEYNKKRDFKQTSEPKGKKESTSGMLRFVVQRHAATRLHYDFRLEMDGVLKSWAVPKGPSLNPADKRLAMMVEDHPFSYRTFEGTIPEGNYGAGEVEIWDEGFYKPLEEKPDANPNTIMMHELHAGSMKFVLEGKKLKGEFALVKIKNSKEENAWLLIKHKDKYAEENPYNAENFTSKNSRVTRLVQEKSASKTRASKKKSDNEEVKKNFRNFDPYISSEKKLASYIKPMLATLTDKPFSDNGWIYEIKWDGYRAVAEVKDELRFYSRNGLSFINKYPPVIDALKAQKHSMVLDGEIVAYGEDGKPSFQTLQHFKENPGAPLIYQVFDLLHLNGQSTESLPLLQRKELLKEALTENEHIRYCDHVDDDGIAFFDVVIKNNLEGMIAKQKDSIYSEGSRSRQWLKVKNHNTTEAVIGGFTQPRGSRTGFGALILGKYADGKLVYTGHTGTGFNELSIQELLTQLTPLITKECPFAVKPKTNMPATWVKPKLVCNIKYSEITKDNIFRHPVFMGLRIDKEAREVNDSDKEVPLKKTVKAKTEKSPGSAPEQKKQAPAKTMEKDKHTENDIPRKIGGKELKLTNLDKVYWPGEGYTKGDLIAYYQSVSEYILPYLKDRAQSLHRFPNGIGELSFYQKDAGAAAPDWVKTANIYSESNEKDIDYVVCNDKATLAYLNNLGCIELNPWNSRIKKIEYPDYMIMDIDPSEKNTFDQVIETALATKEVLDLCVAEAYCKTSGSTGLHVFVPMGAKYDYEQVKNFAHLIADLVQKKLSAFTTLERNLKKRGNTKIYVDYLQNRGGQTIASVYSVRPRPGATVSMPLEWNEVKKGLSPQDFTIQNALSRIKTKGDIFKNVLGKGINMAKSLSMLEKELNK